MPDPYRTYQKGDPTPREAATFNAFARGAQFARDNATKQIAEDREQYRQGSLVKVYNDTGGNLARFSVVGLGDPIFTPTDSEDAFLAEVTFRGHQPSSADIGKFAVLFEPALDGQVVRAFVAGVVQVQVDVANTADTCCDAGTSSDNLVSSSTGSAQMLWKEGGTGVQWAIIRFGISCGAGSYY